MVHGTVVLDSEGFADLELTGFGSIHRVLLQEAFGKLGQCYTSFLLHLALDSSSIPNQVHD